MTQNDLDIDLLYSYVDSGDTDVAEALARILAEVKRLQADKEDRVDRLHRWYGLRFDRLREWVKDLPEEKQHEYFSIVANGTASPFESPVYSQTLNSQRHRIAELKATLAVKEKAQTTVEEECVELQAENKRLSRYEGLYVARHGGTDIDGNKWVYEDTEFGKQVKALQEQSE